MRIRAIAAAVVGMSLFGGVGTSLAQGTGGGPATDPTGNGGNAVVNKGAGSGTGTPADTRGTTTGKPTADPTENGGNAVVNRGAGSGTGTPVTTGQGK